MAQTGYARGNAGSAASGAVSNGLEKRKREYLDYLSGKTEEINEQKTSRRYYHGSQWTAKQIKAFNERKQPVVTYNRIGRKINAVVGLLERQRQDPRGYPRTPQHEEGAEIATAVLRYVMDQQEWAAKSPICGLNGAVDGIGGIEIILEQGDTGDVEVGFEEFDPGSFFYDPRSLKADFSDARYMGIGKWIDLDAAIDMYPDKTDELRSSVESGSELTSDPDSDNKWVVGEANNRRVRIVDHWYMKGNAWHWCIYTGAVMLDEGEGYLFDEKDRSFCKFIAFSANVDQDGDRYGFPRNMISAQDEINQRRSKGLHLLNSRRLIVEEGGGLDIEKTRREAARPDGVITYPQGTTKPEFDDNAKAAELNGHLGFLTDAKQEIENYGFNPALMGTGVSDMSGRAIALQQQAGIAELGPYLLSYKGWKLRVYRAIWNTVQRFWTTERWIRVTDDEKLAEFMAINQPATDEFGNPVLDPATGQQRLVNQLGALDVDIIIDEGPDTINMQADAYDTLTAMARGGQPIPPEVLIELSPVQGSKKQKILDRLDQAKQQASQPPPGAQEAMALELAGKEAQNQERNASAALKQAQAVKTMSEAGQGPSPSAAPTVEPGKLEETQARTIKTLAEARHIAVETQLLPIERLQPQKVTASVSV